LDPETIALIIRITGGNFRLLNRLLTQIKRILEVNTLKEITKTMVAAARESLVIDLSGAKRLLVTRVSTDAPCQP
jgi:Holliday junction resolvasome RuvABC ATP-dependent DNA helicase subunit